ncbi:hypothetical protein GP5015_1954 [gamma proteobacterium HTCC5015]|nr:hypothetical protein GP5015_1954 [gamma proteobacterium HTCC5015]
MSELKLSKELIEDIQQRLVENDAEASDPVTFAQYLAAIMGYRVSDITAPSDRLRDLLEQLCEFSVQVFDQEIQKKQAPPLMPGQEAFGIWRPNNG